MGGDTQVECVRQPSLPYENKPGTIWVLLWKELQPCTLECYHPIWVLLFCLLSGTDPPKTLNFSDVFWAPQKEILR